MGKRYVDGMPDKAQSPNKIFMKDESIVEPHKPAIIGLDGKSIIENKSKSTTSIANGLAIGNKDVESRETINKYNESLFNTRDISVDTINLVGKKLMIRLFKIQKYTEDGMYVGGFVEEVKTRSDLGTKLVQRSEDNQLQEKGVVISVSEDCSDYVKSKIKPGTIVYLDPTRFSPGRAYRALDTSLANRGFDNYFVIHEDVVEWCYN
jgi:hypothetical protein